MEIKEIAKFFSKAGVNVRPKALVALQQNVNALRESMQANGGDAHMEAENDMKLSNDPNEQKIEDEKLIKLVIKKFEELKNYKGDTHDKFLEIDTVKQIFQTLDLSELQNHQDNSHGKNSKTTGFANFIKNTEVKMQEEKEKEIADPTLEVMNSKVFVLDSFTDIPKPRILGTQIVYEPSKNRGILSQAGSRINYYQTRMKMLELQILKDNRFERAKLQHSDTKVEESSPVCLNRINAVLGSDGKIVCLGIIVRGEDGNLHLEDDTMRVKLDLSKANSDQSSYFNEGNIVVVEGEYRGRAFHVEFIDHPSIISKADKKEIARNDNFGAYTFTKNNIQSKDEEVDALANKMHEETHEEEINPNEAIVVLGNLCLDKEDTINTLEKMFEAYEAMTYVTTFIL